MYSFLKAFLVLMKLLSLSQFYAPKSFVISTASSCLLGYAAIEAGLALLSSSAVMKQ